MVFTKKSDKAPSPPQKGAETTEKVPAPQAPQAAQAPAAATDPAMTVAFSKDIATMTRDTVTTTDKKDDPEMTQHPTKDYSLSNNAAMVNGRRQFLPDLLARHLNCEIYLLDVEKAWGENPYGGPMVPINYTREFPTANILYDNFDIVPPENILSMKKDLAHKHGYRYIYQCPAKVLTSEELDKQLAVEKPFLKP